MPSRHVTIINRLGLHARAAAKFVQAATRFGCDIGVIRDGKRVNGKSIMGLMMLAASQGCEIDLVTEGEDEEAAMTALVELIEGRFGESE